jgi:hypothetical protein
VAQERITLTYLNVRESIAILLFRLVLIDILAALITIGLYFVLVRGEQLTNIAFSNTPIFLISFITLGILKIATNSLVILQWLYEYYEITPEYIVHKHGILFKKQEHYRLDHVRGMDVVDSFLGELFNFATITLYDIRLNKYLDMYLIHNARRYAKVLKQLRPHLEMREDRVWIPLVKKEEISEIEDHKNEG